MKKSLKSNFDVCTWYAGHVWNHLTKGTPVLRIHKIQPRLATPQVSTQATQGCFGRQLVTLGVVDNRLATGNWKFVGNWKFLEGFPKWRCFSHLTFRWKKPVYLQKKWLQNISSIESLNPLRSASENPLRFSDKPKVWQFAVENLRRSHLFLRMFECLLFYFWPAVPYNTQIAAWLGHLLVTKIVMMTVGLWKGNSWAQLILPNSSFLRSFSEWSWCRISPLSGWSGLSNQHHETR